MWTSRRGWIHAVSHWAASADGARHRSAYKLGLTRFLTTITAIAMFADGRTGRNVAVTNARIAERADVSERLVTNVRAVLAGAGWAVEHSRGYGRHGDGLRNRPSIWHLTSRRGRPGCDLPSSSNLLPSRPVKKNSPNARPRGGPSRTRHKGRSRPRPRPLHVQRLAAHLQANCVGIGGASTHPGTWCAVLESSHLHLDQWSGRQLIAAMNTSMRDRNWHWPDVIDNPVGFLRYRIAQLPAIPAENPMPASSRHDQDEDTAPKPRISRERIAHHMAVIRATLAAARRRP